MIIGDNYFIQNKILASNVILEAVPALRTFSQQIRELQRECSTCQGKPEKQQELYGKFNELRQFLVGLPDEKKLLIRTRAGGGNRIRVSYVVGQGNNTDTKFGDL